ncbi:MAG: anti-sigma factor domain-containing protein [Peptococcaceae bacterium]|nr:anti-sigma factor domain-containing protein [Peptococcaceae bacterium]
MVYEGMVVGLKKHSAVVMTSDCRFREIKRAPGMTCGTRVYFTDADLAGPAAGISLRFTAFAASLLLCLALAYTLLQGFMDRRAFAFVALEVNPALEISFNREMKAIKLTALNQDGRAVAGGLKIRGEEPGGAVRAVLNACLEKGYLNADHKQVLISTTFSVENPALQEDLDRRIWEAAREVVAAGQSGASIYIFNAAPAVREQAAKKGVSAVRYLLWQDAQESGIQCDLKGPLTGPGFSRSAGKLAVLSTETGNKDSHSAPGPAFPPAQSGQAAPEHSSPGTGTAPAKKKSNFKDHAAPPDTGEDTDDGKIRSGGRPGDAGDTGPAGPDKAEKTGGRPTTPAAADNGGKAAPGQENKDKAKDNMLNPDRTHPGGDSGPFPPDNDAKRPNNPPQTDDPAAKDGQSESAIPNVRSRESGGTGGSDSGSGSVGGHKSGGSGGGDGKRGR